MSNTLKWTRQYAPTLRRTMAEKRLTRRDLERTTGYSYEHIRKIVSGHPVVSEAANLAICRALGLDVDEMWALAVSEKVTRRFGTRALLNREANRELQEFADVWHRLSQAERKRMLRIADGWLAAKECQSSLDAPEVASSR